MSDIYLTKVERKTIFTQGLIYVLFTFVIADLTVTGPHIFSVFPWLFFMGILGVNKFYHPVMTVIFSTITTFIASLFKYDGLNINVLTSTAVSLSVITAGLIVGLCIREFILEHRLVKMMTIKRKILNILTICLLTVGAIVLYSCRYGNIIGYGISRAKVSNYMKELGNVTYEITELQYVPGSFSDYVYRLDVSGSKIDLSVKKDVTYTNFEETKSILNEELSKTFNYSKDNIIAKAYYEFKEVSLFPSNIIVNIDISKIESIDDNITKDIVKSINNAFEFKDKYETEVTRVILNVSGVAQVITRENLININEEYIKNSFYIEEDELKIN